MIQRILGIANAFLSGMLIVNHTKDTFFVARRSLNTFPDSIAGPRVVYDFDGEGNHEVHPGEIVYVDSEGNFYRDK